MTLEAAATSARPVARWSRGVDRPRRGDMLTRGGETEPLLLLRRPWLTSCRSAQAGNASLLKDSSSWCARDEERDTSLCSWWHAWRSTWNWCCSFATMSSSGVSWAPPGRMAEEEEEEEEEEEGWECWWDGPNAGPRERRIRASRPPLPARGYKNRW